MADFYDYTDERYYAALKRSVKVYKWKLELLDYQDGVIKEIVIDLDSSNAGSINSTNTQGSCRSCSFTFTNPDYNYSIIENNPFWDRRRFKLYIGLANGEDMYWFSKGIYITKSASVNQHTITVQAVDKFGLLDGSLNVAPAFLKTVFKEGLRIGDLIRLILLQDIGNGVLLDATEPIIDPDIANLKLYKTFEMSVGSYYGTLLQDILTPLGCDIYYDALGRLIVNRRFDDVLPYWNFHLGVEYTFSDEDIHYQDPSNNYDFNGANYIVVETDDNSIENARYVLENHNPQSPVCVEKVGYKAYDNGASVYISVGDTSIDTPERKCKEYAEYMLLQHTCNTVTKSFNTPILPHLDARHTIRVSDQPMIEDGEVMLVTSLSIPFGAPNDMSVTASNIQWLLTDEESTSLTSEVGARSVPKFTISYSGTIKNKDNIDINYVDVSDYEGSAIILPTSGVKYKNYDLGYFNADKVFSGWRDNQVGNIHTAGSLYTVPAQNITMTPNWVDAQRAVVVMDNITAGTHFIYSLESTGHSVPELVFWATLDKYSNEKYISSGSFNPAYSYVQETTGQFKVDYLYPPNYVTTLPMFSALSAYDDSKITGIDLSGLTAMTSLSQGNNYFSQLEEFALPVNLQSLQYSGFMKNCPKLNSFVFPTANCTITDNEFLKNSGGTNMADEFVIPENITIISDGADCLTECNIGKKLIINGSVQPSAQSFRFVIPSLVEEVELNGSVHYSSIDSSTANNITRFIVGANAQIDSLGGFGGSATFDAVISSTHIVSLAGAFNGYNGNSIIVDSSSITEIINSFSGSSISEFEFPLNVQTISSCFNSADIESITFNSRVISISNSFNGCTKLNNVSIPASVTSLEFVFAGCSSLTTMTILNPSLDLSALNSALSYLTTIRGYTGSTAETFATEHNLTFEAIT